MTNTIDEVLACKILLTILPQIVVAGGKILEITANSHCQLFQALKGGQNKFGVITRLNLFTYPSPQLYSVSTKLNV
jgi:hypothetical protein